MLVNAFDSGGNYLNINGTKNKFDCSYAVQKITSEILKNTMDRVAVHNHKTTRNRLFIRWTFFSVNEVIWNIFFSLSLTSSINTCNLNWKARFLCKHTQNLCVYFRIISIFGRQFARILVEKNSIHRLFSFFSNARSNLYVFTH